MFVLFIVYKSARDVPFDRRSSRLLCERRNPLAGYSGVPQTRKLDPEDTMPQHYVH